MTYPPQCDPATEMLDWHNLGYNTGIVIGNYGESSTIEVFGVIPEEVKRAMKEAGIKFEE